MSAKSVLHPWDISKYLIDRSGTKLMLTNEDHILYSFVLQHMSSKTIDEIQRFLQEQGATTL